MSLSDNPELRLILIGEKEAGKSAAGNAILGRQGFDAVGVRTRASLQKHAQVRGQRLTLVDTPGWEWFSSRGVPASSIAARKEMVGGSAGLCQPGAHGLLLVIPLAYSFGGRERRVAEEHVEMFGQRAWGHTLVVFTIFDRRRLRDSSLEEEVEENEDLQALVDKCGGRYHALYGRPLRGNDQVAELLQKVQAMVKGNGGALLSSEEILLEASKREEEDEQREEEDMREREKELSKMREALKLLKEEEDA
ncbi:GTPase IMAP family member 4, partial [Alosa sapidissima]|uniref:GTPase IMAP family member 4 n=1 Tax=Alosa sapidissima TaxID=34773 RepID=UPI001C08052C